MMDTRKQYLKAFGLLRALREAQKTGNEDKAAQVTELLGKLPDDRQIFHAAIYATFCAYGHRAMPMAVEFINRADLDDQMQRTAAPRTEMIQLYLRAVRYREGNRQMGSDYFPYTNFNKWKPELRLVCAAHNARLLASLTPEDIAQRAAALPSINDLTDSISIFESDAEQRILSGEDSEYNEGLHG